MSNDARNNYRKNPGDEEARKFDPYTHAVTVISEPHRLIHDGMFFDASGIIASVANGANLDILMKFPAGSIGHMTLVEFSPEDAPLDIFFYGDTTVSADGSTVNVRNHNRVAAALSNGDDASASIFTGPTVTDVGTLLHERYIPSAAAQGQQQAGMLVSGEDAEWVLGHPALAKNYLWRVTNSSGGAIKIGFHMNGYEIGYLD